MPSAVDSRENTKHGVVHAGPLVAKSAIIETRLSKQAVAGIRPVKSVLLPLKRVRGPDGGPLMLSDLPTAHTTRWVARRKGELVCAVRGGLLSVEEACRRYAMTVEEFRAWVRAFERFGVSGLRSRAGRARREQHGKIVHNSSNS
jgi:hypothetical protein